MSGDILEKIRAKSSLRLEERKRKIPFEEMLELARAAPRRASFKSALRAKGGSPAVIAELKKASPSLGLIRADFEPVKLAVAFEGAGASALSVLTEEDFFLGSPEFLREVCQTVSIPVLRKDFIFDKYQIAEARALGASAVLLIAKMLSAAEFAELLNFAKSLGLDALCEAHDFSEASMLCENGAEIIGANCRDLRTFEMDFSVSESLVKRLPEGVVKVAESGVYSRAEMIRARQAGADAALVGTALMSKPSPSDELKKLLGTL